MTNIVKQCIAWNKARYDQVLDLGLALKLLAEETDEMFEASTIIDRLDAVGDITFVAIGVLWKAGISAEAIEDLLGLEVDPKIGNASCCSTFMAFGTHGAAVLDLFNTDSIDSNDKLIAVDAAILAIWLCIFELKRLGLQQEYFNIIKAICDSNDTKEVQGKTDPSVKANIVKGASFIPPTMALQRIISQYERITVQ